MKLFYFLSAVLLIVLSSCGGSVSQEDFDKLVDQSRKDKRKLAIIDYRIEQYNKKIGELLRKNDSLKLISNFGFATSVQGSLLDQQSLKEILKEVDPVTVSKARSREDSVNIAVNHQLDKSVEAFKKIDVEADNAVVMMVLTENFLFNQGQTDITKEARWFLTDLAQVMKEEPSIDLMVEGHTDNIPARYSAKDNWELSVRRAVEVVRILQNDLGVDPKRLIPSGRSSHYPIATNKTKEGRAMNRRIRFILMPDLNKFLDLVDTGKDSKLNAKNR